MCACEAETENFILSLQLVEVWNVFHGFFEHYVPENLLFRNFQRTSMRQPKNDDLPSCREATPLLKSFHFTKGFRWLRVENFQQSIYLHISITLALPLPGRSAYKIPLAYFESTFRAKSWKAFSRNNFSRISFGSRKATLQESYFCNFRLWIGTKILLIVKESSLDVSSVIWTLCRTIHRLNTCLRVWNLILNAKVVDCLVKIFWRKKTSRNDCWSFWWSFSRPRNQLCICFRLENVFSSL